jgi:hypothetical protein
LGLIPFPFGDLGHAREEAVRSAERLIAAARAAQPGWNPPPFDPALYARALGIPVADSRELTEWDALLIPLKDGFRIVCNGNVRSPARRRFSIAHEIAHTFFDNASEAYQMRLARDRRAPPGCDPLDDLERLCDVVAAELLMPRRAWQEAVAGHGLRAAAIPALARAFGVSREAAALRLVEMAGVPIAAGFFHHAPPPSQPDAWDRVAYRARRVFHGAGFPFLFPAGKSVPESSAIYRASLGVGEVQREQDISVGDRTVAAHVSAVPLPSGSDAQGPPTVCAVVHLAS